MSDLTNRRCGRREALKGALAVTALGSALPGRPAAAEEFDFEEIEAGVDLMHHVAFDHEARVLLRWGEPILPGAPAFDPLNQTADAQEQQFGYNNAFIGYLPLPIHANSSEHGLLVVSHEHTNPELMFPGVEVASRLPLPRELVEIELAALGISVVEAQRGGSDYWGVSGQSRLNRRLTARSTEFALTGPAAGHDRLKTSADPSGTRVIGTLGSRGGGVTPWRTVLIGEAGFDGYFTSALGWGTHFDRFDPAKEPNEPNRFGWLVEIDPYDPASVPAKRTALGRFGHQGAGVALARDGRAVVYSCDGGPISYLYKFVSTGAFDERDRAANFGLLDDGTLHVARFGEDGRLDWLALTHGTGPLTAENGFGGQADILIEVERAADLVGATPLDNPAEAEPNPVTGKVYLMVAGGALWGRIVEIAPADGDHGAASASWHVLLRCGNPADAAAASSWNPATTANGWFDLPDSCAFDHRGRLWVATAGQGPRATGRGDGLWAVATDGAERGTSRHFLRAPYGAALRGPVFVPNGRTLFAAIQHPGRGGADLPGFARQSTFDDPATRWPEFKPGLPMRPAVVAVTRRAGRRIGD